MAIRPLALALSKPLQEILLAGFDAGHWTDADIPSKEASYKVASKLWPSILKDSAKEASKDISESNAVRFLSWIEANFTDMEDEATSKHIPSKRMQDDMDAQGITGARCLLHLELAHFLGRASPDSAIRGGSYGGVANEMDGAKLAIKQRRPTIENALQMSRDRASLRPLDTFYGQLSMDLSKSEDAEIKALASRVLQFWQAAQRNLMSRVGPVIQYIEDYRADYRGRGLPVIYDPEIGNRAMWAESTGIGGSGFIGGGTPLSELGGALSGARDKGDAARAVRCQ